MSAKHYEGEERRVKCDDCDALTKKTDDNSKSTIEFKTTIKIWGTVISFLLLVSMAVIGYYANAASALVSSVNTLNTSVSLQKQMTEINTTKLNSIDNWRYDVERRITTVENKKGLR